MPTLQQQAAKMTRQAAEELFRTARSVSEDRRADYRPAGHARTVQNQLIECAFTPLFYLALLRRAPMGESVVQQRRREMEKTLTTLDAVEAAANENYARLCAAIEVIPDDALDETLPDGGGTVTTADLLFSSYKNLAYHIGQINYLQTMLGDMEMH